MATTRTANKLFRFTALTGTDTTALDGWDGDDLINDDLAIVTVGGYLYLYVLDHDNTSAESSPLIIQPNKNYGTKRWVLKSLACKNLGVSGTLDVSGVARFLGGSTAGITIRINGLTTEELDGVDGLVLNYKGYANGTTQFRNLSIYDGKTNPIVVLTGSSLLAYFYGEVSAATLTDRP